MTRAIDPVSMAIEHMLLVRSLAEKAAAKCGIDGKDKGGAIQRRAKDLPGMVYTVGLVPALTFYMSKVENSQLYTRIYELLRSGDEGRVDIIVEEVFREEREKGKDNSLCKEMGGREAAGYTTLLAMAAATLAEAGILKGDPSSLQGLAASLKKLRDEGGESYAARLLAEYLGEAKKLAEAFFAKE